MKALALIEDLKRRTEAVIKSTKELQLLSEELLNKKENSEKWSAIECIEHLNLYGDFYLPEIDARIKANQHLPAVENYKSSWLGNKFADSVSPKEKLNTMKTFKDKNPVVIGKIRNNVIEEFLTQQTEIMRLLDEASKLNLGKIKTSISISKLLKLKLGDTFRVLIYHNQRHLEQAIRAGN